MRVATLPLDDPAAEPRIGGERGGVKGGQDGSRGDRSGEIIGGEIEIFKGGLI